MFYLISKKRLLLEYNKSKRTNKGVFNWFISPNKILYVLLDLDGVRYLYSSPLEAVDASIKIMLKSDSELMGVIKLNELNFLGEDSVAPNFVSTTSLIDGIEGGKEIKI